MTNAANQSISELGSVAGPVIQANGRLTFEDDLRSGDLLYRGFLPNATFGSGKNSH